MKLVLPALVGGMVVFVITLVFISREAVSGMQKSSCLKTESTVAFRKIDGEVKIVGIDGNGEVNPTILIRTGDFAMMLTVVNEDSVLHPFYIDGLNISTRMLQPGQNEVLTFYPYGEATYNYYIQGKNEPTGQKGQSK